MAPPSRVSFLRTPNDRFHDLPDFPYNPHYLEYGSLRIAYIDEQTDQAGREVFLCLHGQPTWSFLYRKMIPVLLHYTTTSPTAAQFPSRRVIAPDLLGFGRSDKPVKDEVYTFNFHRDSLLYFVRALDLQNITLVVQDWGGLLGLTIPHAEPSRFKRLIVMNTSISAGIRPTQGFLDWLAFSNRNPDMKIGQMIGRGAKHLSKAELAAYDAPFPSQEYKAGVRRFPNLVMIRADMEGVEASKEALAFYGESDAFGANDVFMACGMKDPVLGPPVMRSLSRVWGNGCLYTEVPEAGHFVQEWGEGVAKLAIACFEKQDLVQGVTRVKPAAPKM